MCGPLVRRSDKPWSEEVNAQPLDQTTSGKLTASNPQETNFEYPPAAYFASGGILQFRSNYGGRRCCEALVQS